MRSGFHVAFLFVGLVLFWPAPSAMAHCNVLGFEVNDYGKEGPARDAKALLEKHIVSWAERHNIKSYWKAGKKEVSCKLFLDFGVFDEWTCTAKVRVCYKHKPGKHVVPDS